MVISKTLWIAFFLIGSSYVIATTFNDYDGGENKELQATLRSLAVTSDIKYRYATTKFSMRYHNSHQSPATANFYVNLPSRAYISNFTMNINGNVTVGQVREKEEAKCIYEATVRRGQSAGIIQQQHRFTNVFAMTVNIEANAVGVFELVYQELLQRTLGKYSHVVHLTNTHAISDFLVEVFIKEPQDIIALLVPQIQSDMLVNNSVQITALKSASIEYASNKEVYIKYEPSLEEQQNGISGLFKVQYDVDRSSNPNMIYSIDGYFVHFFAPDSYQYMAKNIVFMLDISGSMSGKKFKQLKEAMVSILNSLQPEDDSFLLGFFDHKVSWMNDKENSFLPASRKNILYAKKYVNNLQIGGSTNIYDALMESVNQLNGQEFKTEKNVLFFLTDGQPTTGESRTAVIRKAVKNANKGDISIIALGFGDNCDFQFLKALASENGGFSRKIYFAADSQLQIANLYKEISTILMKNIQVTYLDSAFNTNELTTHYFDNYYKGSEIIISGPVSKKNFGSEIKVNFQVITRSGFQNQTLILQLDNNTVFENTDMPPDPKLTTIQSLKTITHNTWLYLTLNKLLEGEITPLIKHRVISLGVKYGLVTPLTSMVVTANSTDETQCKHERMYDSGKIFVKKSYNLMSASHASQMVPHLSYWLFFWMTFLLLSV